MQIPQPFDGDGLVAIFAFKGGKAFFANRYVRTEGVGEAWRAWHEGARAPARLQPACLVEPNVHAAA